MMNNYLCCLLVPCKQNNIKLVLCASVYKEREICREWEIHSCVCNLYAKNYQHRTWFYRVIEKRRSSVDADKPRDAFRGQSSSQNIVQFHMLGIVSYCVIVTLSLKRAIFSDIRLQKMS